MFLSEPQKCYESYSFPIKMILLLVAILWHFTIQRKWTAADANRVGRLRADWLQASRSSSGPALASPEKESPTYRIRPVTCWLALGSHHAAR